jgi:hypothetical protein
MSFSDKTWLLVIKVGNKFNFVGKGMRHKNPDEVPILHFILYTLFYILFGNFFVFRNICLCGKGNQKIFIKLFILFTLISIFISQIFINIIISFIYIFKGSFRKFISHFYINIKKDSKKIIYLIICVSKY